MMDRLRLLVLAITVCVAAEARPLAAQASAADPELAREVAAVLADSLLGGGARRDPLVWRGYPLPLDSAVGRILAYRPEFRGRVDGRTMWMGVGELEQQGDTARVIVHRGQHYGGDGPLTFWLERTPYVFVRAGAGWRFVRREFTIHADGGGVRGM